MRVENTVVPKETICYAGIDFAKKSDYTVLTIVATHE